MYRKLFERVGTSRISGMLSISEWVTTVFICAVFLGAAYGVFVEVGKPQSVFGMSEDGEVLIVCGEEVSPCRDSLRLTLVAARAETAEARMLASQFGRDYASARDAYHRELVQMCEKLGVRECRPSAFRNEHTMYVETAQLER